MRYALVNIAEQLVENVIVLEDPAAWECPEGFELVASDVAGPGWLVAGGVPIAPVLPVLAPIVPTSISPAQARLALLGAGLLDDVEAAVAAGSRATQIAWEMATVIERSSPTVVALSAALGLTSDQLDALFTAAAGIRV